MNWFQSSKLDISEPILEGWLDKQSYHLNVWRKRWIVIDNGKLYTFKNKHHYNNPTEIIDLTDSSCFVRDNEDNKDHRNDNKRHTFDLYTFQSKYSFSTSSYNEKKKWMSIIKIISVKLHFVFMIKTK